MCRRSPCKINNECSCYRRSRMMENVGLFILALTLPPSFILQLLHSAPRWRRGTGHVLGLTQSAWHYGVDGRMPSTTQPICSTEAPLLGTEHWSWQPARPVSALQLVVGICIRILSAVRAPIVLAIRVGRRACPGNYSTARYVIWKLVPLLSHHRAKHSITNGKDSWICCWPKLNR